MSCGCSTNSTRLPMGPPGPAGPQGPAGASGTFDITDILWGDLDILQATNNMVVGYYRITNYATTGLIPNTTDPVLGNTEPLIVFAISTSALYHQAWSETYPQDLIYYELNDQSSQGAVVGRIYYRKETIKDLSAPYDWREWKFRRWETSVGSGIYTEFTDPLGGEAYIDRLTFGNSSSGGTCSSIAIDPIALSDITLNGAPSDQLNNILISDVSYSLKFDKTCYNINLTGGVAKHNIFKPNSNNLNLISATHVYAAYDCEIFTNSTPATYLSYYDAFNALNVVLPTA